mmetsp:Transcript_66042/g.76711  ORF Transcript_66042/g.76711 Transcript_66042/m.76711 type:complete len:130 (-) Transcript_66042:11-400(-)
MEEEFVTESVYPREVLESRQLLKDRMVRNALEMRKRHRDSTIHSRRMAHMENNIDFYLKTSVAEFIADLQKQRAADSPDEDIDDLIAYSLRLLEEESIQEEMAMLEYELEQHEKEEREFAEYCAELSGM